MDYKQIHKKIKKNNATFHKDKISFAPMIGFLLVLLAIIAIILSIRWSTSKPSTEELARQSNLQSTPYNWVSNEQQPTTADIKNLEKKQLPLSNKVVVNRQNGPTLYWEEVKVEKGDTLVEILSNYKISKKEVHQLLSASHKKLLTNLSPGQILKFSYNNQHELQTLIHHVSTHRIVTFTRKNSQFDISIEEKKPTTHTVKAKGTIEQSLYEAASKARIPDKVTYQLAKIFKDQINFGKDLQPGDYFTVLYEQDYIDNQAHTPGNIVAAEFVTQQKKHTVVRFKTKDGSIRYYNLKGESLQATFSRIPLPYTKISSHFNPKRRHPILHITRPHWGVDLAAPSGTPVKASGDGKVTFAAKKGGYGNLIIIEHGQSVTTWYAHLKKISPIVKPGIRVKQGQVIGYVGKTGLASGPHLHYEYRVANNPKNPMTVKLPKGNKIPATQMANFKLKAQQLIALLNNDNSPTLYASVENNNPPSKIPS